MLFRHTIERWRSLDYLWLRRMFGDGSRIPPDSLEGYRLPALKNHALRHALRIVRMDGGPRGTGEGAPQDPRLSHSAHLGTETARLISIGRPLRRNFAMLAWWRLKAFATSPQEAPEDFNRALVAFLTGGEGN